MSSWRRHLWTGGILAASFGLWQQGCGSDGGGNGDDGDTGAEICDDEVDNDGDGATDCADAECYAFCESATDYEGIRPAYNGGRGESFNAGWKFALDDPEGAEQLDFDDSEWRTLDVPHDWSIELPFNNMSNGGAGNGYLDGGVGWYRKTFQVPASASIRRMLVQFDGVYMNSEVWINGTRLGKRPYGYSSFEYDITRHVNYDEDNVIAVRVDNDQPNTRWYSGSGIYRNVWLTKVSPVHIPNSGVFVATPTVSDDEATVEVATEVKNLSRDRTAVTATVTITDPDGEAAASNESDAVHVEADEADVIHQSLTVESPALWSIDAPRLYQVTVELQIDGETVDTYTAPLGFRDIAFDPDTGLSLNGERMKLKGVNMHHDLGALGAAINVRAMERQVEILKSMGVNAIRLSHNPPAPEYLAVCDRLGVMVIDEAFDTWKQEKNTKDYHLFFEEWAERDIKDMVRRDRNHPSIVAWSIGNEIYNPTVEDAENLITWVKEEDDTRPLTWASNQMARDTVHREIAAMLDLQGYNYARDASQPDANTYGDYDADHEENPAWNIYGSETAAAVRSRGIYHTPADVVVKTNDGTSEDRQCSSYDNETARFGDTAEISYWLDESRPFVAGSFVWSGFDYIGEPTPYHYHPSKSSYYGIIDTAGFPKDVYYFYQSRWTDEPMVHLLPHWNWTEGEVVTVFVYSNCDSVELFLNDASEGSQNVADDTLRLEWVLDWTPGSVRAECTVDGRVVAVDEVTTAGDPDAVALSADRSTISADGLDLVFVTADILDAEGVMVPTADNDVAFAVSGPGEIVGTDSGNPRDITPYPETTRPAFSGKTLAIVRSTGEPGNIVITAESAGLDDASATVAAE